MSNDLNKEEKDLLKSFENNEWKSVSNIDVEIRNYKVISQNALKKDKRINIRIADRDLMEIKRKAVGEGIPYQSLISSIIHKYVNGRMVDKV